MVIAEQVLDMRKSGVRERPHQLVVLGLEELLCSFGGLVVDEHEPSSERSSEELSKGKRVRGAIGVLDTHDDRPGRVGSERLARRGRTRSGVGEENGSGQCLLAMSGPGAPA